MKKKVLPASGGHSRPPLERMHRLHDLLSNEQPVNCQQLGKDFEVSYKTIQRDLDFMRDRLNLPIEYDPTPLHIPLHRKGGSLSSFAGE